MPAMTIQSDADAALADFNTKLATAVAAVTAMTTVQFPATSYTDATANAAQVKAAGDASLIIANALAGAAAIAGSVIVQVKQILPT